MTHLLLQLHLLAAETESYGDLIRSGPHWLFELTLEAVTAPLAFALGWLWRNRILRHLHRDLHVMRHDLEPEGSICTHVAQRTGRGRLSRGEHCIRADDERQPSELSDGSAATMA